MAQAISPPEGTGPQNTYLVIYTRNSVGLGAEREGYCDARSSQEAADRYRTQGCEVKEIFLITRMRYMEDWK